jgi:hypothetical protein
MPSFLPGLREPGLPLTILAAGQITVKAVDR